MRASASIELVVTRADYFPSSLPVSTQPFKGVFPSTRQRYGRWLAKAISFTVQAQDLPVEDRRFILDASESALVQDYKAATQEAPLSPAVHQAAVGQLAYGMIARPLSASGRYPHPFIAFVILQHIGKDLRFAGPEQISPFLAGIQYAIRCLVLQQAVQDAATEGIPLSEAVVQRLEWIQEGKHTVFSWIRQMLHLTASYAFNLETRPRFIWGNDQGQSFSFDGYTIAIDSWRAMVLHQVQSTYTTYKSVINMLGLPLEWFRIDRDVTDAVAQAGAGYNFLRHGQNWFLDVRAREIKKEVLKSNKFACLINGQLIWLGGRIRPLLRELDVLLKKLLTTIHLTGGQPARGTEIIETLLLNILGRLRNLVVVNSRAVIIGELNKTTFSSGQDKIIPRVLPSLVSDMLIGYVAYLRPLVRLFNREYQRMPDEYIQLTHQKLFVTGGRALTTDDLSGSLKRLSMEMLGLPEEQALGTAAFRQCTIYIGSRCIQTQEIRDTEIAALMDFQAGHSSAVAERWYGREGAGLTSRRSQDVISAFTAVSRLHHRFLGLEEEDIGRVGVPVSTSHSLAP